MTETKTVNWKDVAENSDNPEIKEKYELFKAETDPQKQRSLRGLIVAMIKTDAAQKATENEAEPTQDPEQPQTAPENVQPEPKSDPENVQNDNSEKPNDPEQTEPLDELTDVEKLKFWKDRIIALENSRLKNETYEQRRKLNRKIYEANEEIAKLRESIRNAKRAAKMEEMRKSNHVSALALKQARIEHLIQKGFSLTNITKHPEGVKASELEKVIESGKFLENIEQKQRGFTAMWLRWKAKFLK